VSPFENLVRLLHLQYNKPIHNNKSLLLQHSISYFRCSAEIQEMLYYS